MNRHCRTFLIAIPVIAILLGWYATTTLCAERPSAADQVRWVRTADGWEKAWWLKKPSPPAAAVAHPGLVATLMLLCSVALLSLGRPPQVRATNPPRHLEMAPEDRL